MKYDQHWDVAVDRTSWGQRGAVNCLSDVLVLVTASASASWCVDAEVLYTTNFP